MKSKIILLPIIILIFFVPVFVMAQEFNPQVGIPGDNSGFKAGESVEVTPSTFAEYVITIYEWGIRIIIVLAVVMIMVGGFLWMTAGGSSQKVNLAKKRINSAIIGLVLALGSYAILNFVNPELVSFRSLSLTDIKEEKEIKTTKVCSTANTEKYSIGRSFCFDINNQSIRYFNLEDLDIMANIEDFDMFVFRYGVDNNWCEGCDQEDDYDNIDTFESNVILTIDENATSIDEITNMACLGEGALGNFCDNFGVDFLDRTATYSGVGIKIAAIDNDEGNIDGLMVKFGEDGDGAASAYITDVELWTTSYCTEGSEE